MKLWKTAKSRWAKNWMKNYDFKRCFKCFALFEKSERVSWTSAIFTIIFSNSENRLSFILFAVGVFDQLFVVNICASSRAERASKNFMNCWTLEDWRDERRRNILTRNPSRLYLALVFKKTLHQKWFGFSAVSFFIFKFKFFTLSALKHDICSATTFEDILSGIVNMSHGNFINLCGEIG